MLKRFLCAVLCAVFGLLAVGCNIKTDTTDFAEFETKVTTDADQAELTYNAGYLRIGLIKAGLDTANQQSVMYSLSSKTKTANVDHGDGFFSIGSTDKGFFSVDNQNKTVRIYDFNGKETLYKKVETTAQFFATSYVDSSGTYLMYNNPETCEIMIVDLETDKSYITGKAGEKNEALGFSDGWFYIKSGPTSLLKVNVKERMLITAFDDNDISIVTMYGGADTGNNMQFKYIDTSTADQVDYITYRKVDEVAVSVIPQGVVTVTSHENGDVLRIYKKQTDTLREIALSGSFCDLSVIDENRIIVLNKTDYGYFAKLYNISEIKMQKTVQTGAIIKETESLESVASTENIQSTVSAVTSESVESNISTVTSENTESTPVRENTEHIINGVPLIAQNPEYPTGCESVTAVMALNYAGYNVDVAEFVDNYLPKSADFTYTDGIKYGPDPNKYFIGNPRTAGSFGCYADTVISAINNYNHAITVENATGSDVATLCEKYIDNDIPVIFWATISMVESYKSEKWTLPDGSEFYWRANEHCLLLVGYDSDGYYFNDPYTAKTVKYDKTLTETRYSELYMQALTLY